MKAPALFMLLAAAALLGSAAAANPLSKTIELLEALQAKVLKQGEAEAKAFDEYMEWCDDETKNGAFLIKSLYVKKEKAAAGMDKAKACIETCESQTEELA